MQSEVSPALETPYKFGILLKQTEVALISGYGGTDVWDEV